MRPGGYSGGASSAVAYLDDVAAQWPCGHTRSMTALSSDGCPICRGRAYVATLPDKRTTVHISVDRDGKTLQLTTSGAGYMRSRYDAAQHAAGFRWVSLDVDGYRSGSANEILQISKPDS